MDGSTTSDSYGDSASYLRDRNAEIRSALARIRNSQTFVHSTKLFAFLEFLVLSAIRGEDGSLKETSIGVAFYGRDPSYDPKKDSIVRTQASRLRDRLQEYYRNEGAGDPVLIELAKGSYVPVFHLRETVGVPQATGSSPSAKEPATTRHKSLRRIAIAGSLGVALLAAVVFWSPSSRRLGVSSYTQLTHDGQPKWLVGTDGVRLFIGTGSLFTPGLAQVPVAGGEISPIPVVRSGLRPLALSPGGDQILLSDYSPPNLWSLNLVGGELQRLADAAGAEGAWSPDGRRLAFAQGDGLWVAATNGSDSRKIADIKSRRLYGLEWSPDGHRLRFTIWRRDKVPSLWEISADGSNLHQLLAGWHQPPDEEEGRWTPDGRYYIFQSKGQIWGLPEPRQLPFLRGETEPVQLTNSPLKLASPLPARDGKTIYAIGRSDRGTLVRYNSASRSFEPHLGGLSAEYVDFTKDGDWVVYVTYPDGALWRSRKDGTDRLRLNTPPPNAPMMYPVLPRWSPDGRRIVFFAQSPEGRFRAYSIPAGGGDAELMFQEGPVGLHDAQWSPDGSRMVMTYDKGSPPGEVWITEPGLKRPAMMPGARGYYGPRWSPDGRRILAMSQNPLGLALFDLQTGKWSSLASINGSFPNWSRDGRYVYFLRFPENPAVVRIDIATRKVETVVDLQDLRMTGFVGAWLGLAPDDSPLLLRDAGTQDVYALELSH